MRASQGLCGIEEPTVEVSDANIHQHSLHEV